MYADTVTPDGYTVNADGAWVEDGEVQRRPADIQQLLSQGNLFVGIASGGNTSGDSGSSSYWQEVWSQK